MFSYFGLRTFTAWLLIFMQIITPVISMAPLTVRAAESSEVQETVQGLNALITGEQEDISPASSPRPFVDPLGSPPALPDIQPEAGTRATFPWDPSLLPDLSIPSGESASEDSDRHKSDRPSQGDDAAGGFASGAVQAGQLFSSDNTVDATINYARGIGEGLVNQQINDWLNQFGNAKVSLNSGRRVSGDILIPVYNTERDLLFTQWGMRNSEDRNTINAGLGFRHYLDDSMLGVNSFYDYDYTGKNSRFGVGGELWRDYLKLSANGYFRLTQWHQSPLSAMEDYDERPANGFDIRAEGYLPGWPNLGANLKYEQYFGKGVSLANSASVDSLKDNPKAFTAGVSWTPFPLLTLSASRSVGDSNNTRVGLDLAYRPGVPWSRQISPSSVDLMRSLAGSLYDFVDRNYDIVMQYRKQILLQISLPERKSAQASETLTIPLTVSTAKYGLKSVNWTVAPELMANGGRYSVVSPTQIEVTLPAYIFTRSNTPQEYKITAVASDTRGNESNTAVMILAVTPSTNVIGNLTLSPAGVVLVADNRNTYTATVSVQDKDGTPLPGQVLIYRVDGLNDEEGANGATVVPTRSSRSVRSLSGTDTARATTGVDGTASVSIRSRVAGTGTLTVTMANGNSASGTLKFMPDTTTAAVSAVTLDGTEVSKAANGVNTFSYTVKVVDANNNAVSGVTVIPLVDKPGLTVSAAGSTDTSGKTTVILSGSKKVVSDITVSASTSTGNTASLDADKKVSFVAGDPAQNMSSVAVDNSTYVAGTDIQVTVALKDAQGNTVKGQTSALTGTAVTVANATVKTGSGWTDNANGTYTRTYTAIATGTGLTASLKLDGWGEAKTSPAYAITQGAAAQATSAIAVDKAAYMAGADIAVTVTLKDAQGNGVTGQTSVLTAVTVANATAKTGSGWTDHQNGTYTRTYTAIATGTGLTAAVKLDGWNAAKISPAYAITPGAAVQAASAIAVDKATYIAGTDIAVTVTLKDAQGNTVTGQASALTGTAVTVANATAKTGSNWTDNANGTYTRTYTAIATGTGLTASLKLDGWNAAKTSEAYTITPGAAVQAASAIATDKATYMAGADIAVTVTLKDAQGNGVTGQTSALTAVTVANATAKTDSWTDNANGTYTRTYTATTTGTGLTASLKLDGWNAAKTSEAYAITPGTAVQAASAIATDNTTYMAGTDIQVTVTLKDAQGNGVTGQTPALTGTAVTVANATVKTGSNWTDNANGTYTRTYTAIATGTGLTASLKLDGWNAAKTSPAYAITQGVAAQATSAIAVDKATYMAGADIAVTVTLKDAQGNGVTGQTSALTGTTVTVANATAKTDSWTDNANGTYTRTYTATTTGTSLTASLKLDGWNAAKTSEAYAITPGAAVQAASAIAVDKATYMAGADIAVTVTLKDAQGNGVTGQTSALTAVTVANATAKTGSNWTDNANGTYTRTYTAIATGTSLKAAVKLDGWNEAKTSEAYAITPGAAAQATSAIAVDKATYMAGADIAVTVTLKDAQGNTVTGQTSALTGTTVTVANATAKTDSWTDNANGTYTRTYTATTTGTSLKAAVKLDGWNEAKTSEAYAITPGAAAQATSAIAVDKATYIAGTDIAVTVTLKDAQGNTVTGQTSALTGTTVTVANATAKTDSWTDNANGTYTRTYTATTTGTGLTASLKLDGWNAAKTSPAYAITQGVAAQATSGIAVDKATYIAGADIAVTVTLKDAQGNTVTGQTSALTGTTVTVANATAKTGSNWTDNANGTYTRTYTAIATGTGLTASLKLDGWGEAKTSPAYAITQGAAAQATSAIAVDKATYMAGTDIAVTVTLKDAQGNGVTGQTSALTAVTVANATAKTGSNWTDNANGTYTRTYTAIATGTGLTASLKLDGWNAAKTSEVYAITPGTAVQATSGIAVDKATYIAGTDIAVTVTLKDAQGNTVTGQTSALTGTTVTVANATAKTGSNWTDNANGTYTRTYTATTTGTSLTASLKLDGWNEAKTSEAYAITPGAAVQAASAIATDKATYMAGADIAVTVTLKDAQGNGVTGQASALTAVTVANATAKTDSWTDNANGTYTRTYTATTTGTSLTASLKLDGWNAAKTSEAYAITPGTAVQAASAIATDKATYMAGTDIQVTVTLKDAQGNGVTGQTSALTGTTVTVANATAKTGSNWTDNANGTYTRTYTAIATGTSLTAAVKLDGWNEAKTSEAYTITQGAAAQATSAIAVDKATYIAGTDIAVTVTLKDAQGNTVTGQTSALTGTTVTVANATAKTDSNWTDNANGTYTRTYTATTTGTGLKASLKLDGWNEAKTSEAYTITPGAAVQAASAIATDKATYIAGTDIAVTVTLKDAQGNTVTGQTSALTGTTVTVANATAKTDSWTDNANGTYTRTYTATTTGTGLTASLKLDGWNAAKTSPAYAITQGVAAQATSAIAVDKATYIAGTDIAVTVTLKDAQGNTVTGQTSALTGTTVTVANATAKTGSNWTDNANGTYTRTYTAIATGTGLTASLKLDGWGEAKTSPAYAITQGAAAQATSAIAVDKATYIAGTDIAVTVTLKDAQGNGVTGQTSALTGTTVTVANATAKTGSNWTDNANGTYTRTYTATTTGTGLTASLKLDGWNAAKTSEAYAITPGAAVQAASAIATDNTTYMAGTDIQVTVTLKDAQGNTVTGQTSALTGTTVTVANATAKTGSNWTDNANGTYTRTYTATTTGTSLTASLKLDGWNEAKTSEVYAITPGAAVQAASAIATDKATYMAGADIAVTVTLKDAQGNGVTGQASALTAVTVANATAKTDSWTDNANGTYTRTYTATTTGTSLTASLKLDGWNAAKTSEAYTITPGAAVQAASAIATDNTTYMAGTDIQVTVTLKDAQGNGVTGQTSALTGTTVTVANATAKTGSNWTDNANGTYTRTYTATTTGTGLTASLKLDGWNAAKTSEAYTITPGAAAQATSAIAVDKATYMAGTDIQVTVTLKDAQGNTVTGQTSALTGTTVTVANATAKTDSWTDNANGTYTRTYTATTTGTGLKAAVKLDGWNAAKTSEAYAITPGVAAQAASAIAVDKATYMAGTDIQVTVTLKDAQGNTVTGQTSALTGTAVTVANATAKTDSWTDNANGTYTRTYTATTTGTGLTAAVQLDGWDKANTSEAYTITPGAVAQATSAIATDNTTYMAGTDIEVTVTLKDALGNGVTGQTSALTDTTVTVANATAKTDSWKDNANGTYTRTYTGIAIGTRLTAAVQLDGWDKAKISPAYAITPGAAVQSASTIVIDKDSYLAGTLVGVKVTLKDALGNGVTDLTSAALDKVVTVPNTVFYLTGWRSLGNGTYDCSFIAKQTGTGLKASLMVDGWDGANTSTAYTITPGFPEQSRSYITTDRDSYMAGEVIQVTVTLIEYHLNAVPGRASMLTDTAVKVDNATARTSWTDHQDGTYSRAYTANTVGTSLTAKLKLSGWSSSTGPNTSEAYAITQGTAALATSAIAVDKTAYVAGTDIEVTVTLKDAQGNTVTGKTSALTDSTVTVANATAKTSWTDHQDGTYSRTYTAKAVGTSLTAKLKLDYWSAWDEAKTSPAYVITPGAAAQANSAIAVDKATYVAGADIQVTMTLKDEQGNGVTGQASALTGTAVTVANATAKTGSNWTDNANGNYTRTYTATTTGTSLTAAVKLDGWGEAKTSQAYAITTGAEDGSTSMFLIDKDKIIANSNSTGTDSATLTLTVRDAYNNALTGVEDNIQFVVSDSNGKEVSSGVTVSSVSASVAAGVYTATVSGNAVGSYTLKVKVNNAYLGSLNQNLALTTYTFALNTVSKIIAQGGTYQFIVQATSTDTNKTVNVSSDINWKSANTNIATIIPTTGIATGAGVGTTDITASGTYQGIPFNVKAALSVEAPVESPDYGEGEPGDTSNTYIVAPPDYEIVVRCGSIVDAVGTSKESTGGNGGNEIRIKNVNQVKSIDVVTGIWSGNKRLAQLTFYLSDGTVIGTCGNLNGVTSQNKSTFTVPDGHVLQGVKPGGGSYINTIAFITVPKN